MNEDKTKSQKDQGQEPENKSEESPVYHDINQGSEGSQQQGKEQQEGEEEEMV